MGDGGDNGGGVGGDGVNPSHVLFDRFVQASTCKGTLKAFQELCDHLELKPCEYRVFYHKLKSKLNYWKAKALWAKLDKRANQKEYKKGRACANSKCVIIGAGPCGLRTAIELGFLGAKVVLLEKRDAFSRNNVLHLWPFTIQDLRGLGAKKFHGKFCAGAIDHISIRQLQLMLLKVALLLGIEIHVNVEFKGLIEPPEDQENERIGWRAEVHPRTHPVNELEFDVIIGADGRRNTLAGFRRKEFRGKLAIAITANFINRNTTAEASVEEISGVAFIFNQKFFQDLREATGIDLENIVYYKDDTHYFVMTAKKQSLLEKGVILHDYADTEMLLSRANVDQTALLSYAREAADFSTNQQLPTLDFAINHYGQPDVAMFDFTCMYASENAALVRQRHGHQLLVALVGDSLLEPFWPMGTGIARGFLAAMDSAWMVRSWAQGNTTLQVLAERESIYRLLPQTTPENVSKNFSHYSVNPTTRYPNICLNFLRPNQVRHLVDTGEQTDMRIEMENVVNSSTPKLTRNESVARSSKLLNWCQRQTDGYRSVSVTDLTMSWKSGLALCALIHRYRPDLIDFDSLAERDQERNNQLGFDVAEREFGISPCMTGKEMSSVVEPDKLSMVMYLSQFYEMFKDTVPPGENQNLSPEEKAALISSTKSPISFLSKLGQSIAISRKRNPKDKKEKEVDVLGKRRKTSQAGHSEDDEVSRASRDERPSVSNALTERKVESAAGGNHNKVKSMATQLLAKFEENAPAQSSGLKRQGSLRKEFPVNIGGSDVCFFCRKRVYVMERLSAEGKFFHRSCFKCDYCGTTLRLSSYAFDVEDGKFYCKPHYCYRLSGQTQRKRSAPTPTTPNNKDNQVSQPSPVTVDAPGRALTAATTPTQRRPSGAEVNGLQEPSLAKRLRGTPERIELENYRTPQQKEEELEEVPEETLAEHNLSSVLDKATDADLLGSSSSSESDMGDEDEDQDEPGEEGLPSPSDLGGVPWKEAVELHAQLRTDSDPEAGSPERALAGPAREEEPEEEYEEEEEDEEEEEEDSSDDACNEDDPDAEADSPDLEPGTEMDQEEIPSDAEAEARLHQSENSEALPEEDRKSEARGIISSIEQSTVSPVKEVGHVVLMPVKALSEMDKQKSPTAQPSPVQSPGPRFFPEPNGPEEVQSERTAQAASPRSPLAPSPSASPNLVTSPSPAPAVSPLRSPVRSPIRSQPLPLPETVPVKSPVLPSRSSCPLTGNPLSPICARPLSCPEPCSPLASSSPVRSQPVPVAVTSTPYSKPPSDWSTPELQKSLDSFDETPSKKADIIEEFWLKSAEIRKSLGLTPLDRSRASERTSPKLSTPDSSSPKSQSPDLSEDLKPAFTSGRSVIRRLNITLEGQVISPVEPRADGSERRDLSSSSGLGLNGSSSRTATSDNYNTSDSTMLTPPSSPPPPPPNESPAVVRQQKHQVSWSNGTHPSPLPVAKPEAAAPAAREPASTKTKNPVPSPRTQLSPVGAAPTPAPRTAVAVPAPVTSPAPAPVVMRRERSKPRREEVRKSFVECVAEIPFADDVDDAYDERTPDTTAQERFYTPPTSRPGRDKPPLHLALAMENGKPNIPVAGPPGQASKGQKATQFSPEAKEIAEERMRAREKSVKSQALKDAMAKQLDRMKESEAAKGAAAKVAWSVSPSESAGKGGKLSSSPKTSAVKALESKRAETLPERFFTSNKSLDGSLASSDCSSGGKSKKRSSLFSPRKNKKEKKSKSDSRGSDKRGTDDSPPKHKSLWKAVFSGYKKDKKKKEDKSCPSTPSSSTTQDSGKKRTPPLGKSSDLRCRRNLSFSEDSDLSCDDVLERSSQKSKMESVYVPHALAFKRSYATKKTYTEEELNAKLTRRVQKAARRQAKQEELKRLHRAQIIQRQLEQVEEKQRQLEERGVAVEKALRGEADYWGESNYSEFLDLHLGGMGKKDDPKLMQEWFKLVQEKNALVRYESELMIFARELELEDRQSRLQQDLRERMAVEDHLKSEVELAEEKRILGEMLEVVEQRDSLVALLEEQRLREKEEDRDLESVMLSKGFNLNWA
ncbi:protein-methionine sulfoxide oxidase mical3a isoform X4 [Hypomesus transpacificus]|uniref:protein-methionine sulfoxide oxidase mical3a isoform X4 n=1 Tax=Hypomesus transpacificus TaxID=137520 RepID=UPI001F075084|nr:protein-methionine sulfoxide oxidase mical3a isoform X4 [Hypomesus transpacificus]